MKFLVNSEQKNDSGIYIIRNSVNDKFYIGSAVNLRKRHSTHCGELRGNYHHSARLQNFANKYGLETLSFEVLVTCLPHQLLTTEQLMLNCFQPFKPEVGFNICPNATSTLGRPHTQEARDKMSKSRKGKKLGPRPEDATARTAAAHRGMKRTDETKRRMSDAQKAAWIKKGGLTPEESARRSAALKGRAVSEKSRQATREAWTGRKHTPEAIEKMRAARAGTKMPPRTDEMKTAMAEKTKQWWANKRAEDPTYTRREITHCPQGHEYNEANTYLAPSGNRQCRACRKFQNDKRIAKAKAA